MFTIKRQMKRNGILKMRDGTADNTLDQYQGHYIIK